MTDVLIGIYLFIAVIGFFKSFGRLVVHLEDNNHSKAYLLLGVPFAFLMAALWPVVLGLLLVVIVISKL